LGELDDSRFIASRLERRRDEYVRVYDHTHDSIMVEGAMNDELGNRIKNYYEDPARVLLPRKTYVIVRVDGRAFHTFTAKMERPYCRSLANALDAAAVALSKEMDGFAFAYGQSDEYSFLLSDFGREDSRMWFEGAIQKIASVSASIVTAAFARAFEGPVGTFDARAFAIPQREEVAKYFIWRQVDASRNSLNMLASSYYSHAELLGKSEKQKHDLLHAKGQNWAKWPADFKRGRVVKRGGEVDREIPVFTRERAYLDAMIPSSDR
jgi:tRNA(His) 5'-end guanylyltransferase